CERRHDVPSIPGAFYWRRLYRQSLSGHFEKTDLIRPIECRRPGSHNVMNNLVSFDGVLASISTNDGSKVSHNLCISRRLACGRLSSSPSEKHDHVPTGRVLEITRRIRTLRLNCLVGVEIQHREACNFPCPDNARQIIRT